MTSQRDTKLFDFAGGQVAGLMIQYLAWCSVSSLLVEQSIFTRDNFMHALLYMLAFGLASIVCLWKSHLRTLIGWILVAMLGAALSTGIQEYIVAKAFEAHRMVLFEWPGWIVLNFISKAITSLTVVGLFHYGG